MNEITQIHLGRQAFTIAIDAHQLLKIYLQAIKTEAAENSDVIEEVELRIAELLTERNIIGEKVVLVKDIEYVKEQLGDPEEFKEETDEPSGAPSPKPDKKLFRDTEHGMLAGVSSGLAAYFGINTLVVRLVLALTAIFGGGISVPVYVLLWILVPEAKTQSDKLQMHGKPVTVDNLKEVVERADVKGAARRAERTLGPIIESIFKVILAIVGVSLIVGAIAVFVGLATAVAASLLNPTVLNDVVLFPSGSLETALVIVGLVMAFIICTLVLLTGLAMVRRKWSVPGWVMAALAGIFISGIVFSAAVGARVTPDVRDRFNTIHQSETRQVKPFNKLDVKGKDARISYQYSTKHEVYISYIGKTKLSDIKTTVQNDTLTVDLEKFKPTEECKGYCSLLNLEPSIIVYSPTVDGINLDGGELHYEFPEQPDDNNGQPLPDVRYREQ